MTNSISKCPKCKSTNLITLIGDRVPHPHYGSVECGDCGAWVRWLPNPAVSQEFEQRKQIIEAALANGLVSGWELMFLREIKERRYLSAKQRQKFEQICTRHQLKTLSVGTG